MSTWQDLSKHLADCEYKGYRFSCLPMSLSYFAPVGDYYTIFGALDLESKTESITHELIALAGNSIDTLQALEDYIE